MTDGSQIAERLVRFDEQHGWTAELSEFTGRPASTLLQVDDDWRFVERADGTDIRLTWTFHPRPTVRARLLTRAVVAPLHRIYLRRVLERAVALAAAETAAHPVPTA